MSCDPLSYLGSDIFTNVLWFLSVRDLARGECVSTGWAKLSKSNRRLWRTLCIEAKVMQQDLVPARFWDVPTYQSPLTECDWRTSCEWMSILWVSDARSQGALGGKGGGNGAIHMLRN